MAFGKMGARGGFGSFGVLGGARSGIQLSASAFTAGAAQATAIGTLSVVGGTGTYTFTLTDSHSSAVQVAGTSGVNLQVGSAASSAGSFSITVHATNGVASTFDRTFTIIAWSAVSNSVAPAITGSAVQGVTLSVSNGTWAGSPAPTFVYQWKRAGSPITGATAPTYSVQAADVGSAITCTVTASNGFSSASATSSATASVTKTTLSYTPVTSAIQGSAYTGATPTTTNGTSPYTYSVTGALPTGLSVSPSTGVISGTPTTVQTVSGIVLVVTDANGVTDSASPFSIAVSVLPAFVTDVLSVNSLVGYWRATDTVGSTTLKDFSPSNLPATITGGVTLGSTALLSGQSSALFNGTTGFAQLGSAGGTAFNWEFTQPWTIEFIIKPNSTRSGSAVQEMIWSKILTSSPFTGTQVGLYYNGSVANANVIRFFFGGSPGLGIDLSGSTDLTNGSTWHVVVSYNGSGLASGVSIYVNGVPDTINVAVDTLGGSSILNTTNPCIGAWGNGSQFFYQGNLEELAIYNTSIVTVASLAPANIFSAERPALHASLMLGRTKPALPSGVPNVILLTDIASDIDDCGDVALSNALHLRGEINLIGIVTDSINDRSADAAFAITKYMQPSKTTAFVGAWQGSTPAGTPSNSFYTADISTTFGANLGRASFTDGVQKLRALLATVADGSMPIIVGTGFAVVLDGLLTSAANAGGDGLASGSALITAKNVVLVWSAGIMPSTAAAEFNLANGPAANSSDVIANWPTQVIMDGIELGNTVLAGPPSTAASGTNPVQQAFHDWVTNGGATTRQCWGMLAVLYAARQTSSGLQLAGLKSAMTVNSSTGVNTYIPGTAGNISYLKKSASDATLAALFTSMYAALPSAF